VLLTPLSANLDVGLLNFILDWFPTETRVKRKQNEREAATEELERMGFRDPGCIVG
jgi:hypothetical protein